HRGRRSPAEHGLVCRWKVADRGRNHGRKGKGGSRQTNPEGDPPRRTGGCAAQAEAGPGEFQFANSGARFRAEIASPGVPAHHPPPHTKTTPPPAPPPPRHPRGQPPPPHPPPAPPRGSPPPTNQKPPRTRWGARPVPSPPFLTPPVPTRDPTPTK